MQLRFISFLFVMVVANIFGSEVTDDRSVAVIATVDAFHNALQRGDAKAAMDLLSPDAIILESGSAQSRAEYEREHLREDIAFAQAIPSSRSVLSVRFEGDVAWIASTSRVTGSFHDRKINSAGTEFMILTKSSLGWRIRAIHWSSHEIKSDK